MLIKEELKHRIADTAYSAMYAAKQHFATYDIINMFPKFVSVISLIISIILLGYPKQESKELAVILLILSVLSLYLERNSKEKENYHQKAKSLNKIYKELKSLYFEVDDKNIDESTKKLQKLDLELDEICSSNHILFLTAWVAHYNMFFICRENSKWFVNELGLSLWKDKIPESLKLIVLLIIIGCFYKFDMSAICELWENQ